MAHIRKLKFDQQEPH